MARSGIPSASRSTERGPGPARQRSRVRLEARAWELTLDAELPAAAATVTDERAREIAGLLARIRGVGAVSVRPHRGGRFLLATLAVEAVDLSEAVDRAVVFLRSCATAAGVGPLILVAARYSRPPERTPA